MGATEIESAVDSQNFANKDRACPSFPAVGDVLKAGQGATMRVCHTSLWLLCL